jgi:hypothetical protein
MKLMFPPMAGHLYSKSLFSFAAVAAVVGVFTNNHKGVTDNFSSTLYRW